MLTYPIIGAALIVGGILYLAFAAISRGRMSDPHDNPQDRTTHTLEPRHRGLGFLASRATWPGHAMIALGILIILLPLVI